MIRILLLLSALWFCLSSCLDWRRRPIEPPPPHKVLGYKPVYTTDSTILRIAADTARPVKNAGKIYAFGDLLFQNEMGEGVHVLDMQDPSNVKNLGFLRIRGNTEISIKGQFLYANSYSDLVVVNLANWRQPAEVKRMKNAFQQGLQQGGDYRFIPLPEHNVYFECSGVVTGYQTGWVKDSISGYSCFYR